jgi:hypothetical protein
MRIVGLIATIFCNVEPNERFGSFAIRIRHLTEEHLGVLAFPISLSDVCGNASRTPTDLIRERIRLFWRKCLRLVKKAHGQLIRQLIHPEIFESLWLHDGSPNAETAAECLLPTAYCFPFRDTLVIRTEFPAALNVTWLM